MDVHIELLKASNSGGKQAGSVSDGYIDQIGF